MNAPGISGPRLGEKRTFSQIGYDKYRDQIMYLLVAKNDYERL